MFEELITTLCTGCRACQNACPVGAIQMVEDSYRSPVAHIDSKKCHQCGLCRKVCPQLSAFRGSNPESCHVAWLDPSKKPLQSSSGGIAHALSSEIINHGGVVFGAIWEGNKVRHGSAKCMEELAKFAGSKYVQSDTEFTFSEVKDLLAKEKEVLYLGTPCQIEGLLSFLGGRHELLTTCDLVCHGVPPVGILQDYLVEATGATSFLNVQFRDQEGYALTVTKMDNTQIRQGIECNLYLLGFMQSLFCRENCYSCRCAQEKRIGDLTLGDFWGLDRSTLQKQAPDFVSLVLVNTAQGRKLFEAILTNIYQEERSLAEAVAGNSQLQAPAWRNTDRELFFQIYKRKGFLKAVKSTGVYEHCNTPAGKRYRFRQKARRYLLRRLFRMLGIRKDI